MAVEGKTEVEFVKRVLVPALGEVGVAATPVSMDGNVTRHGPGGGEPVPELRLPSKRILALIPDYRKCLHGPRVAENVGLVAMRAECRRFGRWMDRLERLGP